MLPSLSPPACSSQRIQWRPSSIPSILMLLILMASLTSISWSAPSSLPRMMLWMTSILLSWGSFLEMSSHWSVLTSQRSPRDYPIEFLNSLNVSGLPLAHLHVKLGCPLMLLRNMDPSWPLQWYTSYTVGGQDHVLKCHILGGKHAGNVVFIPRITLEPSEESLPIPLSHCQSQSMLHLP